ncbi:MAG: hypothetical protein LC114_11025 [Bryobacterales bacterium]|nr:hypothetical protein [Bryobacterales bacterium]
MRRCFILVCLGVAWNPFGSLQAQERPAVEGLAALRGVKRLCIEEFDGGENARQLRALVIAELHRLDLFVITENPKRADAYLRGFAEETRFTERHSLNESLSGRSSGSVSTGGYTRNRSAASRSEGVSLATREGSERRRQEASLSIRIVTPEGDVLWSGSAESRGGKFRSAGADVAIRIAASLKASMQSGSPVMPNSP